MMTYDAKDGYVILVGGVGVGCTPFGDTWKFLDGVWTNITPSHSPAPRYGAGLAYDAKDGYVVLFGGAYPTSSCGAQKFYRDTWKFSAGVWSRLSPTTSPPARDNLMMTYDAMDGYVVLFGGALPSKYFADTWAFSGGDWVQVISTHHPTAQGSAEMTYDAKDGYVVFYSWADEDTWEYLGGAWTVLATTGTPPSPSDVGWGSMAYDARDGYVVLFGGFSGTWTYVGGAWTQLTPAVSPSYREVRDMAYDATDGYVVFFGGAIVSPLGDTWTFVAEFWTQLPLTYPSPRDSASMTYDAADGYVVLFGGYGPSGMLGDTWVFYNGVWANITPSVSPSPRLGASMTYDAKDGYVLLFGGNCYYCSTNDTWKFLDGYWTNITPAVSPPARYGASMTYDAKDGYVVLFGGYGNAGYLGDTWEFGAGVWTRLYPSASPGARDDYGMTYDAKDGYVVLFGGYSAAGYYGDTWEFVGGAWTLISPLTAPGSREGPSMTYDAKDGYVLLFGGSYYNDTWTFAKGHWTDRTPSFSPPGRFPVGVAYDNQTGYTVMFGGFSYTTGYLADTWTYVGAAWTPLVIAEAYSGTYVVNTVVSNGTEALVDLLFTNGTSEFVFFDALTASTYGVQWVPGGSSAPTLISTTTAGGLYWLAWKDTSTGRTSWETINSSGTIAYPVLPVGPDLSWQFVYGNATALYVSAGAYLVEVNATSYAMVANYSKPIPTNLSVATVVPLGNRLYLAGSWSLTNGATSAYFGYLNLTSNKLTRVSKLITNYPSDSFAGFYAVIASGGNLYVGGVRELYTVSPLRYQTLEGYLYKFVPATSSFKNLSALLPVRGWGVFALEQWGPTIAVSVTGYNATSANSYQSFAGGIYTLSPKGTSLLNQTYLLPKGYAASAYEVTAESGFWLFSGGLNLVSGASEVVAIPV